MCASSLPLAGKEHRETRRGVSRNIAGRTNRLGEAEADHAEYLAAAIVKFSNLIRIIPD